MLDKLKAQPPALWPNYVAGWTEGYALNGMTAQEIISGSENAIIKGLTGGYDIGKPLRPIQQPGRNIKQPSPHKI